MHVAIAVSISPALTSRSAVSCFNLKIVVVVMAKFVKKFTGFADFYARRGCQLHS